MEEESMTDNAVATIAKSLDGLTSVHPGHIVSMARTIIRQRQEIDELKKELQVVIKPHG
jgi:protein-arginine kinase activator protein McsA